MVLFIRILLCKSRKQFSQPCHMKFVNSPISFRLNKKVGLKLQFFVKILKGCIGHAECNSTERFLPEFCEKWKQNCFGEKNFVFSKFLRTCSTHFWQPWWSFWDKVREWVWVYDFFSKNVIWFKIFFCKPKNSKQFHTFAKIFLWRVRSFVAHSAKTRLKLCFLKKITLRHSPKMILNL